NITSRNNTKLPPGPWGLPFIGTLHQLDVSKPHVLFWELSKKYGPLMSLRLGFSPSLVVSSAKMAKEILKTHDLQFCSRPALVAQQKLSYNGLDLAFSPYDEYWREIRKICAIHLFNSNRGQNFRPIEKMNLIHQQASRPLFVELVLARGYFPFIGWIDKLTGMLQRPQNNFQEIDRVYQELIDKHLDPNRAKIEQLQQEDVIDVLLQI
ncbi:hypothetical protein CISIN_1g040924mg, partial [Citrus sinensis]